MAQITIQNLESEVIVGLRELARERGESLDETVREVLRAAVIADEPEVGLGTQISRRFAELGFDDEIREWRGQPFNPPDFS
jgi:plasmid stability protein